VGGAVRGPGYRSATDEVGVVFGPVGSLAGRAFPRRYLEA